MEKNKFYMGFWNYLNTGLRSPDLLLRDWEELGMNLAMSTSYDSTTSKKDLLDKELELALGKNISVIVCDSRTHWTTLQHCSEKEFREGVIAAKDDFGGKKAVVGFNVCDEPTKADIPHVIRAAKIVREIMPDMLPFVNFFPNWGDDGFRDAMGVSGAEYYKLVADTVTSANVPVVSYDFYQQCSVYDADRGLELYFKNLNLFKKASDCAKVPLWTSLLSVGHWNFKVPVSDDFRWQLSTAAAHGCKGILWFYIYCRKKVPSYRGAPIDEFFEKTETFSALTREIKIFMKYFAESFADATLKTVEHYGRCYGGTKPFCADGLIEGIEGRTDTPLIVSRFIKSNRKETAVIVNNSQTLPANFRITSSKLFEAIGNAQSFWLAPGELLWLE